MNSDRRINVVVRVRPKLIREEFDSLCVAKSNDTTLTLTTGTEVGVALGGAQAHHGSNSASFRFDCVFDEADDQLTLYEESAVDMIDFALQGGNATIFAYGQTGSGKTHTVLGEVSPQGTITANTGLFLRAFDDIFRYRDRCFRQKLVVVALTAVELYMDEVLDLLQERKKLRIRDTGAASGGVFLSGARSFIVRSLTDVVELFNIANSLRAVKSTLMNDTSSRSHALFFIDVFQAVKSDGITLSEASLFDAQGDLLVEATPGVIRSRIALVDLAGSERVKRSGVEGVEMQEATAINKSLTTLGTVIAGMHSGTAHLPFRESNLTKILRPSFTDRSSRLLLIGQLAPSSDSFSESHSTTKFCDRVKTLPAAGESPLVDPAVEMAYLTVRRRNAEIAADLRIVTDIQQSMFVQRAPLAAETRKLPAWGTQRSLRTQKRGTPSPFNLTRRMAENEIQVAAAVATESTLLIANRLAEANERQRLLLYQTSVDGMVEPQRDLRRDLEQTLQREDIKAVELTQFLANVLAEQDAESNEKLTDAKRSKKKRVTATEQKEKLVAAKEALDHEGVAVAAQIAKIQRAVAATLTAEEEEQWEDFEENWRTLESNHQIVREFAIHWRAVHGMHKDYVQLRYKVMKGEERVERDEGIVRNNVSVYDTPSVLAADLVEFLVDRSVDIAHGISQHGDSFSWALDVKGLSRRILPAHAWNPRYLDVTNPISVAPPGKIEPVCLSTNDWSPEQAPITPDTTDLSPSASVNLALSRNSSTVGQFRGQGRQVPTSAPVDGASNSRPSTPTEALEISHEAAAKAAREKRKNLKADTGSVTSKYDSDEADKHYLMTVYDSPTLVPDVIKYLCAGSVLIKHGRSGDPHKRRVSISNASSVREIVWVDVDAKPVDTETKRGAIALSTISHIVLGQYSKVFRRHGGNPKNPDFFLSFSLHTKDGSRTLDLVAPTLVDFEAWVLGLAHLCRITPIWGKTLDVSKDEQLHRLTPGEKALCESQNIFPTVFVRLKERLVQHRSEVLLHLRLFEGDEREGYKSMGGIHAPQKNQRDAVLVTKGELRWFGNRMDIDIFRVCKLFELFRDQGIIFDTSFVPAVNFPTNPQSK